jgi:hypothetical protein
VAALNSGKRPCDAWSPFFSALTHVVRNAVDHGIELAAQRIASQRIAAQKPALATLCLRAIFAENALSFAAASQRFIQR